MDADLFLKYVGTIGGLLISWPVVILVAIWLLREELGEFIINLRSGKIGPVQFRAFEKLVERGHSSLTTVEQLNIEIAKTRITELEITQQLMPNDEFERSVERMKELISELEASIPKTSVVDQKPKRGSKKNQQIAQKY